MKRKTLVTLLAASLAVIGGLAVYAPWTGPEMVTVGIARWATNSEFDRSIKGFKQGLADHGYVEGKNIRFILKSSEADLALQHEIIESFIQEDVDLIFTLTTPGTLVAQELTGQMTNPIPVVFSVCTYPVESGLIASLDQSDNNLVGTRNYVPFPQQYFMFEQLVPDIRSLAVVRRKGESNSTNQFKEVSELLGNRGIKVVDIAAVDLDDIKRQLEENIDNIDAIFSTCDTLTHLGGDEVIAEFSNRYKIPTFACNMEGVLNGLLSGNIANFEAIAQISGEQAALILDGADPSWLKTESPRDNYIVINETTAEALGIHISAVFSESIMETVK